MAESAARKMGPAAPAFMPAGAKRQRAFMPRTLMPQTFMPAAAGGLSRRERRMGGEAAAETAKRLSAGAGSFMSGAKAAAGEFFGSQLYLYYCLCGWSSNNICRNAAQKYLRFTSPLPENLLAAAAAALMRRLLPLSAAKTHFAAFAIGSVRAASHRSGAGAAFPVMQFRRKPAASASGRSSGTGGSAPGKSVSATRISRPLNRFGKTKIRSGGTAAAEFAASLLPHQLKYRPNPIH